jgi:hypothetical protein
LGHDSSSLADAFKNIMLTSWSTPTWSAYAFQPAVLARECSTGNAQSSHLPGTLEEIRFVSSNAVILSLTSGTVSTPGLHTSATVFRINYHRTSSSCLQQLAICCYSLNQKCYQRTGVQFVRTSEVRCCHNKVVHYRIALCVMLTKSGISKSLSNTMLRMMS